ncbi:hypothetical protein RSOLAG1IB_03411 [Rhizoctonia solani AG-1 IB]|uniref:Uncharacterized protein n=1 Tax=Thanatephorus cucumeris (strain AG1-IB / isolate 7/3/14) TaxID=1108050 RepID=A0A0B7FTC0_THACB|nr:hypothetical protein RSOLAG1IB_03411 [Rhizoctonia solani AG-1 IB]
MQCTSYSRHQVWTVLSSSRSDVAQDMKLHLCNSTTADVGGADHRAACLGLDPSVTRQLQSGNAKFSAETEQDTRALAGASVTMVRWPTKDM